MGHVACRLGIKGWSVQLDVGDLGGHLDVTHRERAGTLANRFAIATSQLGLCTPIWFFLG